MNSSASVRTCATVVVLVVTSAVVVELTLVVCIPA